MAETPKKTNKGGYVQTGDRRLYTIDAAGKSLGRVASEVASILLGKKSVNYVQNEVLPVEVHVQNVAQLKLAEKRVAQKTYVRYTGYPGGLITTPMQMLIDKKGMAEVFRKTVDGMIPRNKLRKERMKRLIVID
jgi:large subunit ribosomal protein L13